MPTVLRCPSCELLTMLSSCPSCQTLTVAYLSSGGRGGEGPIRRGPAGPADGSVESPQSAMAHQRREALLRAAAESVDDLRAQSAAAVTAQSAADCSGLDRAELVRELQRAGERRAGLLDRLEALAGANLALSSQLADDRAQMVVAARRVLELMESRRAAPPPADRHAALQLRMRENTTLRQAEMARHSEGYFSPSPPRSGRPSSNAPPSTVPASDQRPRPSADAIPPLSSWSRPPRGRPDGGVDTPVSTAMESHSQTGRSSVEEADELAALRRTLSEKDRQLKRLSSRAQRAEAMVEALADDLDGVRGPCLDESGRLLSMPEVDMGGGVDLTSPISQQYSDMVARRDGGQGNVNSIREVNYNGRAMPSSLNGPRPCAEADRPPYPRRSKAESLVS